MVCLPQQGRASAVFTAAPQYLERAWLIISAQKKMLNLMKVWMLPDVENYFQRLALGPGIEHFPQLFPRERGRTGFLSRVPHLQEGSWVP